MRHSAAVPAVLLFTLTACSNPDARPDAPAADPDSATVEEVGVSILAEDRHQTFPAEDPVAGALWYSEFTNSFADQTIMLARRSGGTLQTPEVAPFSGEYGDRAPRFSPDGSRLYFSSNRPRPDGTDGGDMNLWFVEREGVGWGAPQPVAGPGTSDANDMHVSITDAGMWFASDRPGGLGRSDIYHVDADGTLEHLPAPVNGELSQPDLWVSPDERWMILAITDHPDGHGGDDLYVSRREGGSWSAPANLGTQVNTPEYEYGPSISADGRYLYFTSHRTGPGRIYRVPLTQLGLPPGR